MTLKPRIIALLDEGVPRKEIAQRLGCSIGNVSFVAGMLGFPMQKRTPADKQAIAEIDWDAVRTLAGFGWSQAKIAAHFRVGRSVMQTGMLKRGIAAAHEYRGARRKKGGAVIDAGPSVSTTPHTRNSADTEPSDLQPEQLQV